MEATIQPVLHSTKNTPLHNYNSESIEFSKGSHYKLKGVGSSDLNLAGESVSMQESMLRLVDHTAAAQRVTKIEANIHLQPFLQNYYTQKTYADNFTSNATLPIHSNVPSTFNVDVNIIPS